MKALFLYTELAPYVLSCMDHLACTHGVEVHVVHWPVNKEAPFDLGMLNGLSFHPRDPLSDAALLRLAQEVDPDVVFVSGWVDKGYANVCNAMREHGRRVVLCSDTAWRGDLRQWVNVLQYRTVKAGSYTNAWVTGAKQADYAHRLGVPCEKIRTGFYCADTRIFKDVHCRRSEASNGGWPHRFLFVARYIPTKGHQVLCDAFAELCDQGDASDWELWIAGTGELVELVMNSPSGRHSRIRHLGFKQPAEMVRLAGDCGVFVLPSLFEPWGVVVQEYACSGMPLLLSSAVGSAERFLEEGRNGFQFQAGDKVAMKNALRNAIARSDDELRRMGEWSAELGAAWGPEDWSSTAMELMIGH